MIGLRRMEINEAKKIIVKWEKLVNEGKAEDKRELVEEARKVNHAYWIKVFRRMK